MRKSPIYNFRSPVSIPGKSNPSVSSSSSNFYLSVSASKKSDPSDSSLTSNFYLLTSNKGFTLIELAIYAAMFAVASVAFIAILVSITKVQVRQSAVAEVNQQSQFLLQNIQRYVESSSMVEMAQDSVTSTLRLRMSSSTFDPTLIYLSGGTIYLQEAGGAPQALTSGKVNITDMSFIKRSNSRGKDSVNISFTMEYDAPNTQQRFSQALNISVARVSAATFDSDILPATNDAYKLGVMAGDWQSINDTIYFDGSNVGIGINPPSAKLQVNGGDIYVDTTAKGLILRDGVGGCWRVTVNSSGTISSASLTCP